MKRIDGCTSPSEPAREREHFHNRVAQELIHEDGGGTRVVMVGFEPGARTFWHRHPGGQVLHVASGEGLIQSEGGEVQPLRPGDLVVAPPGELHWHGATDATPMTHLSITIGAAEWMDH